MTGKCIRRLFTPGRTKSLGPQLHLASTLSRRQPLLPLTSRYQLLPAVVHPYTTLPALIAEVLKVELRPIESNANPVALVDPSVVNALLLAVIRHYQPLANHICSSGYHAICSVRCSSTTYT